MGHYSKKKACLLDSPDFRKGNKKLIPHLPDKFLDSEEDETLFYDRYSPNNRKG